MTSDTASSGAPSRGAAPSQPGAPAPSRATARFALLLLAIVFVLRIPYAGYVWADEGLWFTVADELLRGKALYTEIWFDKPPAVAWVYAALFAAAGPSVLAVRLFTILYAAGVAVALWHLGRRFWGEREGRLAALLYAVYNATYIHSQVQPLAVDHLVLLPYLYAGYFFLTGRGLWSGLLAAAAFSLNPKAGVLFFFFALAEVFRSRLGARPDSWRGGLWAGPRGRRWLLLAAGFALGVSPWIAYLAAGGKLWMYGRDFWLWGFQYVTVYSPLEALLTGARRTLNYAGFHLPLFLGLAMLLSWAPRGREGTERAWSHALLLWLAVSYLGVAAGGRFFPRYFYQVLPLLCLLGARGYVLAAGADAGRGPRVSRILRALFWAGLVFAVVRFHHRGAVLAYEAVTGKQTAFMANWTDPAIDRGSRLIAERVRGSLFVWGYRPEIYFYCRCEPVSMYLSSQPLTGVPADIHLREARSVAPAEAAANRARLVTELKQHLPESIVDGLGPYNPALAMERYPELAALLREDYERAETVGMGIIYRRR